MLKQFKFLFKKSPRSWVATVIACLFAAILSGVSIFSAFALNRNMTVLSEHPFSVSVSLFRVRRAISDERIRIERLGMYNQQEDVEIVREAIRKNEEKIRENAAYIYRYYIGEANETEVLEQLIDAIARQENELLNDASTQSAQENNAMIQKNLTPLYEDFDNQTNQMIVYTEEMVDRLSEISNNILKITIILTLTFTMGIIVLAVRYQRSMLQKMRDQDIYYREFLFKILSENIDDVFLIKNLGTNRIEFASTNAERIFGLDSRKLESGSDTLLAHCILNETKTIQEVLESNGQERLEQECSFRNPATGEEKDIQIGVYPAGYEKGVHYCIVKVSDLTKSKQTQQILRDAMLNAQKASEAKTDFLSRMSHEIRTPMNAIIGMTTIAATVLDQPERLEVYLSKISKSSRHLLLLINDILDMSKIESGKLTVSNETFRLPELIDNISSMIYYQTRDKGQTYDAVTNVMHESLIGDSLRLNQILINLLSNAVKYTPSGGNIRLTIEELPSHSKNIAQLRFTISDNGIGMSPQFQEKLFLPFEQEKYISGGTGLGLAITKNLIQLLNGSIQVESSQGEGSTFWVEIPYEIDGDSVGARYQAPGQLDDLKVLVADDDQDTCEHAQIILKRLGICVEWVTSGQEAVERTLAAHLAHNDFDVVILDWKMPHMSGVEVAREIRKAVGPDTVIIIISAFDWTEIEQDARQAGVNAFLSKPLFQSSIYNTLAGLYSYSTVAVPPQKDIIRFFGKRFLLVEDNELNQEIALEFLKMTGAQIDIANNGKEAVERFSASEPGCYSAILMDIQMPEMDGYEATRVIRASGRRDAYKIPIIAMTANAFSEDISDAKQAGMTAHISKPIDLDILCRTISQELGAVQDDSAS